MLYFTSKQEKIKDLLYDLLLKEHQWFICCTAKDPDDFSTYIFENVTRYEEDGYFADMFKSPVFIEYGISRYESEKYYYRIHDSMMAPIVNSQLISNLIDSMIKTFDAFVIEDGIVDRTKVWGKLGTEHVEKVVFHNK